MAALKDGDAAWKAIWGMTPLRAVTWLLTGPVGRVVAFFGDLLAAWGGWALRRSGLRRHPE
jgi:hypothetical protein